MAKLTIKQEKFCNKYVECGNASEAYRSAYSCDKMKNVSIGRKAIELLTNGIITARIEVLQTELKSKSDITKERILSELSAILESKITDYVELTDNTLKFKNFSDLSERQVRAIESVKQGKNGIELSLHGKSWTIEKIVRMLGFDAPTKTEHTGKDGAPLLPSVITAVYKGETIEIDADDI